VVISENIVPVSVLLLTLNEEVNLPRCLEALSWCDDIVVLDSCSNDDTAKIVEKFGARFFQREFDNFAGQRNYALQNIEFKHGWIFHLDADEVITNELVKEISEKISSKSYDAYLIPSKTMFMGKWLRYAGMYPTYQVRLTKSSMFRFKQDGHGQKEVISTERIGRINEPYLHYSFSKGLEDWIAKHNRYSSQEAEDIVYFAGLMDVRWSGLFSKDKYKRRKALKKNSRILPFKPFFRFIYMYFLRLGFLDGRPGFIYSCLLAYYEFMISIKVNEIRFKSETHTH